MTRVRHPLSSQFRNIRRYPDEEVDSTWRGDFEAFAAAVPERPEWPERLFLSRVDPALPWGPQNVTWVPKSVIVQRWRPLSRRCRRGLHLMVGFNLLPIRRSHVCRACRQHVARQNRARRHGNPVPDWSQCPPARYEAPPSAQ